MPILHQVARNRMSNSGSWLDPSEAEVAGVRGSIEGDPRTVKWVQASRSQTGQYWLAKVSAS